MALMSSMPSTGVRMVKRKIDKATCQIRHAKLRAHERCGLDLRDNDITAIIGMIQRGAGKMLERQTSRLRLYSIFYMEKELFPVYDKKRGTLVTFLTSKMVREGRAHHD